MSDAASELRKRKTPQVRKSNDRKIHNKKRKEEEEQTKVLG